MARFLGKVPFEFSPMAVSLNWKGALQIAFDWFLKQTMFARILKEFPNYSGKDLRMFTHTHPHPL